MPIGDLAMLPLGVFMPRLVRDDVRTCHTICSPVARAPCVPARVRDVTARRFRAQFASLGSDGARSLRACCMHLRASVDANVPFDYAALGPLHRSLSGIIEEELALLDIALLRLMNNAEYRLRRRARDAWRGDWMESDAVSCHVRQAAFDAMLLPAMNYASASRGQFLRRTRRRVTRANCHKESICPCWICKSIRLTVRRGFALWAHDNNNARLWRARGRRPSILSRDYVREYLENQNVV